MSADGIIKRIYYAIIKSEGKTNGMPETFIDSEQLGVNEEDTRKSSKFRTIIKNEKKYRKVKQILQK